MDDNLGALEDLKESGIEEAASLLAASFVNSPGYAYIFEHLDEEKRFEALQWIFGNNIRMVLDRAMCKCVYSSQEMVCFFMLQPPGAKKIGTWDLVSHGILTLPFRFGWQAMTRLLQVMDYHDDDYADFFKEQREKGDDAQYCKLERMVVRPEYQGKGVGTKYLGAALKDIGANGQKVILSTQEERNVTFYSRLGFGVSHCRDYFELAKSEEKFKNTVMVREAPIASTAIENNSK